MYRQSVGVDEMVVSTSGKKAYVSEAILFFVLVGKTITANSGNKQLHHRNIAVLKQS